MNRTVAVRRLSPAPKAHDDSERAGTTDDVPALEAALAQDEPLVREHAAWALEWLARTSHE